VNKNNKGAWKPIRSVAAIDKPWFKVTDNDFKDTRDGKEIKNYYIIRKSPAAHIIPINLEKREIVLIKQYRPGPDCNSIEIPAGSIRKNETLLEAAKRELKEETGYEAQGWKTLGSFSSSADRVQGRPQNVFFAWDLKKVCEGQADTGGKAEVLRIKINEAKKMVWSGEILDLMTSMAIMVADDFCAKMGYPKK